ncbi:MAG: NADH-quinone oxidoreductase subunit A [Gemmataceae bacterium]|jgi:NADH:ubiquinone oxidoreductase subunit 3 (subunit A)
MDFDLSAYYPIFIYAVFVFGFAISALSVSHILSPYKITPVKTMPYESGMDPFGDAKKQFDVKFYLIAILFLVFDVELLFLYPWAVSAYAPGLSSLPGFFIGPAFLEVLSFVFVLVVGYIYAWKAGVFQWR